MKIRHEIVKRQDQLLDELIRFCRIPSVSTDPGAAREAAEFVREALASRGVAVQFLESPGNPILYAECPGRRQNSKVLLYYNHYDVVPPGPRETWHVDPFEPSVTGGKLYCRGVSDHKSSLLARIQAIGIVLDLMGYLPITVKMVCEGEEEIGSPHLANVLEKNRGLLQADACLYSGWTRGECDEPRINAGCRGTLGLRITCRVADSNLHASLATLVPDAAIRLASAISVLAEGPLSGEIAGPEGLLGALSAADVDALRRIPFDWDAFKSQRGIRRTFKVGSRLAAVGRQVFCPSVTVSAFEISGGPGAVSSSASAILSIRLVPGQEPGAVIDSVEAHLRSRGFDDVCIEEVGRSRKPSRIPVDHWLVGTVRESVRRVFRRDPVVYPLSSGSGPRDIFIDAGIPVVANVGAGYAGSNDHGPDENIKLQHYLECVEHEVDLIMNGFVSRAADSVG